MELPDFVKITKNEYHKKLLKIAYNYIWQNSEDESTKTGAFLMNKKGGLFAINANHFPDYAKKIPGYNVAPEKYKHVIHGEKGSILKATNENLLVKGLTMYAPWYACNDCADAIIDAKIKKVVGHKQFMDRTPESWIEEVIDGLVKMHGENIELILYDGKIGNSYSMIRGNIWRP